MNNKVKTIVILLLLATLFKGIVWMSLTPVWHTPDEQAHFAQVQYYAEVKKSIGSGNDLSREIYESESLLGTLRDDRGVNKFTYHPEYRIDYTDNFVGLYEKAIAELPFETRTTFVKKEAAQYPPLFYLISSMGYLAAYGQDLFTRVMLTRLVSVLLAVATVWVSYLLGKSVFPREVLLPVAVAAAVSFQPMYTFLSSGINNDTLLIFLSTSLIWLMVDAVRNGFTAKKAVGMGLCLGLGILTKQLIYPLIPLPFLVVLYDLFLKKKTDAGSQVGNLIIILIAALLFGGVFFARSWFASKTLPGWPRPNPQSLTHTLSFSQYLSEKLKLLYRETLPWYWGVFNWLGVVLPISVLRTIKLLMLVSGIGMLKHIFEKLRKHKITTADWQLLFLVFVSLWYAFWLIYWDYSLVKSIGFSHGLQGRNFFPTLAAHMTLLVFGISKLANKLSNELIKLMIVLFVILNFIGLWTMASSYYQLVPFLTFVVQASQYKPWFFKGFGILFWVVLYLTFALNFINQLISYKGSKQ